VHPYEADVGNFLSSKALASDASNHYVPILEVLKMPDRDDVVVLVMAVIEDVRQSAVRDIWRSYYGLLGANVRGE
jgi:hypothetical protein